MVKFFVSMAVSYFVGAIPFALIVAKFFKGIDIRKVGSGNVGATNVYRSVGKVPGVIALALDISKGLVPTLFIAQAFYQFGQNPSWVSLELFRILCGAAAVAGHNWPVFLKFKGGKGVATSTGVLLGLAPKAVLWCFVIWFLTVLASHYVSVASIAASLAFPILAFLLGYKGEVLIFAIILCAVGIYKHKSNIKRLIKREESKVW